MTLERKTQDFISQKQFKEFSGKQSAAIAKAVQSAINNNWIIAKDKEGNLCDTPQKRKRRKIWYQLGVAFTKNQSSSESEQDNLVHKTNKSSSESELNLVRKANNTKLSNKLTIQKGSKLTLAGKDTPEIIHLFEQVNPSCKRYYNNTSQRAACQRLLDLYGFEQIARVIKILPKTNEMKYAPTITTPCQLEDKYKALEAFCKKEFRKAKQKFEDEQIFNQLTSIRHNQ